MNDATEMIIATLAVVLAGTAFAIGGKAIMQALRNAARAAMAQGLHRPANPPRQLPAGQGPAWAWPGRRAGLTLQAREAPRRSRAATQAGARRTPT